MTLNPFTVQARRAAKKLQKMGDRAGNLMAVWPKVGNVVARSERRVFSTRGASIDKPWLPLAVSTRRDRAAGGYGNRTPLVRGGQLKDSLVGRPMSIERYYPDHADYGSDLILAVWQQKGTFRHGKRHIPPRKILGISPSDKQKIRDYITVHIAGRKKL